jgi:hypothetical protein
VLCKAPPDVGQDRHENEFHERRERCERMRENVERLSRRERHAGREGCRHEEREFEDRRDDAREQYREANCDEVLARYYSLDLFSRAAAF